MRLAVSRRAVVVPLVAAVILTLVISPFQAEPARALTSVSYDYGGSGSITIPNYVVSLTVTVWGGGGGGGGSVACIYTSVSNNPLSSSARGGGGGGAGYKSSQTWNNPASGTLTYSAGGGGAAGAGMSIRSTNCSPSSPPNGAAGGATNASFQGTTVSANGGGAGGGGGGSGAGNPSGGYGSSCSAPSENYRTCTGVGGAGGSNSDGSGYGRGGGGGSATVGHGATANDYYISGTPSGGSSGGGGVVRVAYTYYNVTVTGVSPNMGPLAGGTTVTITGTDFEDASAVRVGGVNCQTFTYVSPTEITCVTPPGAETGLVNVSVTTPRGSPSKTDAFLYFEPPVIEAVVPDSGSILGGDAVDIIGQNFLEQTKIDFDGDELVCVFVSGTKITCTTQAHAADTVDVTATTGDASDTLVDGYTFGAPRITASPHYFAADVGGQTMTLTGKAFMTSVDGEFQEVEYLTFNGTQHIDMGMNAGGNTAVTVDYQNTSFSGWMLLFGVRSGSANCMWFGADGDSNAYAYQYGATCPYVENLFSTSFNTTSRHTVTANNDAVSVDGATAVSLGSSVPATSPALFLGAMNESGVPYSVRFAGYIFAASVDKDGTADDRNYVPVRCNISPSCATAVNTGGPASFGEYGMYDTLHDVFYRASSGTLSGGPVVASGASWPTPIHDIYVNDIKVDGVSVGFTVESETEITVDMPNRGVSAAPLAVEITADDWSRTLTGAEGVNYLALTAPSPAKGASSGGDLVTISGSGFSFGGSPTVTMDGNVASEVTVMDDNTLTFKTPAGSLGVVDVVIGGLGLTNGESVALEDAWEYEVSLSLSVSGGGNVAFSLVPGGGANSGYTVATVKTDNTDGYKLTLESSGGNLVCESNASYTIPSITSDGTLTIATGNHGVWGWSVIPPSPTGSWTAGAPDEPNANDWKTIPVGAQTQMADTSTPSALAGDDYGLYFGAMVDNVQPACEYKQVLTVTVTGN